MGGVVSVSISTPTTLGVKGPQVVGAEIPVTEPCEESLLLVM